MDDIQGYFSWAGLNFHGHIIQLDEPIVDWLCLHWKVALNCLSSLWNAHFSPKEQLQYLCHCAIHYKSWGVNVLGWRFLSIYLASSTKSLPPVME
jgi:hypothetical protein